MRIGTDRDDRFDVRLFADDVLDHVGPDARRHNDLRDGLFRCCFICRGAIVGAARGRNQCEHDEQSKQTISKLRFGVSHCVSYNENCY